MRIGIDCRMYSINFTGIGRYVYELINNLAEIDSSGQNQYILFFNPREYERFNPPASNFHKVRVDAPHYSLKEQWHFCKKLKAKKLDLMHFTHFNAPILYKGPFIVTIHDLTLSFFPGKKMRKWYHRLAYQLVIKHSVKKSKKIIAVSNHTQDDLVKLFKVPSEKIKVIYEGVNKEFFQKTLDKEKDLILEKYNIKKPFFLYTGVWRDHKNLVNLIKAFKLFREQNQVKAQLVITGKENPYYPEVKKTTSRLGLENDIIFPGLVHENELVALYQAAKLYTFPSFYEGFGLSLLEAMSCELPVVASNTSCIPEICGEDNAVFFDPHKPQAIADTIYSVYSNHALQAKLKKNGLERVKKFSWAKMAEESHNLYMQSSA